ncbi:hypothetical protein [Aquilutibacter rugosus]|uniref:hypothetical protein n=1 Tax=Aquilutibacter rugosus TaxID=3115820 RepID=UPI002F4282BF
MALTKQLADRGFVELYEIAGEQYLQVINFGKHQNPHIKESASALPAPLPQGVDSKEKPTEHRTSTVQEPCKNGSRPADSLSLDSLNPLTDSPLPLSGEPRSDDAQRTDRRESESAAGYTCRLIKAAGIPRANPGNPNLIAALSEGVTPENLAYYVINAPPGTANPFAYGIAAARNEHAKGATPITTGPKHATAKPNHRLSAVERVRLANERSEQRERELAETDFRVIEHHAPPLAADG